MRCFWLSLAALALALTSRPAFADDAKKPAAADEKDETPEELPPTGLHLAIVPKTEAPWKMIVTNDGTEPRRLIADGRLLWLEIVPAPEKPDEEADAAKKDETKKDDAKKKPKHPKKPPKPQGYLKGKIPLCRLPADMRPEAIAPERAVILDPGDRYEEDFDPFAYCGPGKIYEGLGEGAVVYAHLGWPPEHRGKAKKKPAKKDEKAKQEIPPPPYVAESLKDPADAVPDRSLDAVPIVLTPEALALGDEEAGKGDELGRKFEAPPAESAELKAARKEHKKAEEERDERAPRLEVRAPKYADVATGGDLVIPVTVENAGKRAALVHVRRDDLAFVVKTPTGESVECADDAETRAAVRDFFQSMRAGGKETLSTRIVELCPQSTLARPGVYEIRPMVALHEAGDRFHLTALVGTSEAPAPTKVRIHTGSLPYHARKPLVIKKPKPEDEKKKDETPAKEKPVGVD